MLTQCAPTKKTISSPPANWNYSYDQFNRLVCANLASNGTCATPPTGTPTYTYVYDRWGNRWQQNGAVSFSATFTSNGNNGANNNRMDGYSYDTPGNLISDNVHTYSYDAENRLISITGGTVNSTYVYDADGRRVVKTGNNNECQGYAGDGVYYLYDLEGHQEVMSPNGQNDCRDEIYADGRHLATYNNGDTFFVHTDWLGTERVRHPYYNTYTTSCTSLPFGDNLVCANPSTLDTPTPMHFTGKERDSESGLDHFDFRQYSSPLGRWVSPDPFGGIRLNPQSLNRYAYVLNNPLRFIDPFGLWHCDWGNGEADDTEANGGASRAECQSEGGANWVNDAGDLEGIPGGGISYCLNGCELDSGSLPGSNSGAGMSSSSSSADDPQVGMNIFTNNPQCPDCGHIWNGTNNAVKIATAYTAIVPTLGYGAVVTAPAALAYATGWGYAAYGSGAGFVVGLYPAYLEAAEEGGLGAYSIPGSLYRFFQATGNEWTANQAYIDAQVFLGRQAYLAGPAVVSGNSTLWLELERLKSLGVQPKDWVLLHIPY